MRFKPSFSEEQILWSKGINKVIGIDEVGRGAFAGPIVAASVIYKPNFYEPYLNSVNDSKLLNASQRELLDIEIRKYAYYFAIELIDIPIINRFGIGKANQMVFRKLLNKIKRELGNEYFVLADGMRTRYLPGGIKKQKAIIKGDQKSLSIASASIIAKVYRDSLMKDLGQEYPEYDLASNKGYGTRKHKDAMKANGLSDIHRTSFNFTGLM